MLATLALAATMLTASVAGATVHDPSFCAGQEVPIISSGFGVRLAPEQRSVATGQRIFARVENQGSSTITLGLPYRVQHFEGGRWVEALGGPGPKAIWPMIGIILSPGKSGVCMKYKPPSGAQAGAYRFLKSVRDEETRANTVIRAVFRVAR